MNDKYYVFTGGVDLSACHLVNVKAQDGALVFLRGSVMISPCLDSGVSGTVWDKAEIGFPSSQNGYFCLSVFSSDKLSVNVGGQNAAFEQVLSEIADGKRLSELAADIAAISFLSPDIAPLHTLKGRYAWFILEAFPENDGKLLIEGVKISYPCRSYMEALPEIIRRTDNGALASMLAMYKTVFDKLDRKIVDFDNELDIDTAHGEALQRLVSWQGIPLSVIWGEEILRRVTRESAWLIRRKGTKAALSRLFELLLGEAPYIEENTYGDPYGFTVRVRYELIPDGAHHKELLYLLGEFTPAGIESGLLLDKDGDKAALGGTLLSDEDFDSGIILD